MPKLATDSKTSYISFNDFKNGVLYLKGGDLNEELKSFKNVKIFELSEFFNEDFFNEKKVGKRDKNR